MCNLYNKKFYNVVLTSNLNKIGVINIFNNNKVLMYTHFVKNMAHFNKNFKKVSEYNPKTYLLGYYNYTYLGLKND